MGGVEIYERIAGMDKVSHSIDIIKKVGNGDRQPLYRSSLV